MRLIRKTFHFENFVKDVFIKFLFKLHKRVLFFDDLTHFSIIKETYSYLLIYISKFSVIFISLKKQNLHQVQN